MRQEELVAANKQIEMLLSRERDRCQSMTNTSQILSAWVCCRCQQFALESALMKNELNVTKRRFEAESRQGELYLRDDPVWSGAVSRWISEVLHKMELEKLERNFADRMTGLRHACLRAATLATTPRRTTQMSGELF